MRSEAKIRERYEAVQDAITEKMPEEFPDEDSREFWIELQKERDVLRWVLGIEVFRAEKH